MQPLLNVHDLSISFQIERGMVHPVTGVSFSVFPGQTLALVGESGCGKSISAMSILRLLPRRPLAIPAGRSSLTAKTCSKPMSVTCKAFAAARSP